MGAGLEQFGGQKYLNLETYRKNGEAVATPLWFVEFDGVLYARTSPRSGKVKRLGREPRVRLVPCNRQGEPTGRRVEGEAGLIGGEEARRANRLLGEKYGLLKRAVDLVARARRDRYVTIAIRVYRA